MRTDALLYTRACVRVCGAATHAHGACMLNTYVLYMRADHVGEGDLGRDETVESELRDLGGGR